MSESILVILFTLHPQIILIHCVYRKISFTSNTQFPFLTNLEQHSIDFSKLSELVPKLDEYGFCIIKNVINIDEIFDAKKDIGDDILELLDPNLILSDINLSNEFQLYKNMSRDKIIDEWKISESHFIDKHCLPQGRFVWKLRLSSKIRSIFASVYGSDDLVGGLDSIFYNAGMGNKNHVGNWGHADQNTKRDNCESWSCYQSVIAIFDLKDENSETTVIWPKSHVSVYDTLIEASNPEFSHYIELSLLNDAQFSNPVNGRYLNYKYMKEAKRIPLNAGDMVIWNSKCIHQGFNNNGRRLAMPICYEPACRRTQKAFITKLRLAVLGYSSTHWASIPNRHGKYLEHIENHIEGRKYCYINSEGVRIDFPIKNNLVPFIINDENREEYSKAFNLAQLLDNDNSSSNEDILNQLIPMLKPQILHYL